MQGDCVVGEQSRAVDRCGSHLRIPCVTHARSPAQHQRSTYYILLGVPCTAKFAAAFILRYCCGESFSMLSTRRKAPVASSPLLSDPVGSIIALSSYVGVQKNAVIHRG